MSSGPPPEGQRLPKGKDVPFDWGLDENPNGTRRSDLGHDRLQKKQLTLSPQEASIFKNIFEEIAEGKMPNNSASQRPGRPGKAEGPPNFIEHAQMTEFRDKYLERFPSSLKRAAERAMGLFAQNPSKDQEAAMTQADRELWAERQRYQKIMVEENLRVKKLMNACLSDLELWKVMEAEVFSLPVRLGIASDTQQSKTRKMRRTKAVKSVEHDLKEAKGEEKQQVQQGKTEDGKEPELIMDIHGALYSQYLLHGLKLFDSTFLQPSPFAFQILPRVKSLGLTSYILGVSTPFFTTLARQHWQRYGDGNSALDMIQELTSSGLYANEDVQALLTEMRDHLTSCTIGRQGPFAQALMQVSPYDGSLMDRIDEVEEMAQDSIDRYMNTYGEASAV